MAIALLDSTPARLRRARRARRARRTVLPATLAVLLLGLALLCAGAAVAQRGAGGYFSTAATTLGTPTSALVTREVDVAAGAPGDPSADVGDLGVVRIRAAAQGQAVFVGIGPTDQVEQYLRDSAYDALGSFRTGPLRITFNRHPGARQPDGPAGQRFWVATASGTSATLVWPKRSGAWSAVVMNSDASPGLRVRTDVGLRFAGLTPLAAGLAVGAATLAAAVLVVRRRTRR